jgi:hypothetical protein
MKIQNLILVMFLLLLTSAQAGAAGVSWNSVGDGLWSISTNWNPVRVPDSGDDVYINGFGTYTITVSTTATAKTLTVGGEKKITLSTGKLTIATGATLQVSTYSDYAGASWGMAFDSTDTLYVLDTSSTTVNKITTGGVSSVWITADQYLGNPDRTGTNIPIDIAFDASNNAYISNDGGNMDSNQYILQAPVADPTAIAIYAGTGTRGRDNNSDPLLATFKRPYGMARYGTLLYVADSGNGYIRKIDLSTGAVSDFVATSGNYDVAVDADGNVYTCSNNVINKYASSGGAAAATYTLSDNPATPHLYSLAVTSAGNILAPDSVNHIVWQITPAGTATVLAGIPGSSGLTNGGLSEAQFYAPRGIAIDSAGAIYIGDTDNNLIRKISY